MIKHLYIHIPFCKRICPYCDFNKRVSSTEIMEKYRDTLIREIKDSKNDLSNIETIYIGGGTPSFYPYIEDILKTIKEYIDINNIKEYSIESTPETILDIINLLPIYGINRVSIGVESLNQKTIEYLNRKNTSFNELKNIVGKLKNVGINNINLDFIYSLPFETIDSIKNEIDDVLKLGVTHLSFYDLIIEDKTKLSYDLSNKLISLPNEEENIMMRDYIIDTLESNGFKRYEISNYAIKSYESIHNLSYWELEDYIGIGLGSHSLVNDKRYYNTLNIYEYLNYKSIKDMAEQYNLPPNIVRIRLNKGWDIKSALTTPLRKYVKSENFR